MPVLYCVFHISIAIGLSIAATAIVSRAIGRGDMTAARELAGSALYLIAGVSLFLVLLSYPFWMSY